MLIDEKPTKRHFLASYDQQRRRELSSGMENCHEDRHYDFSRSTRASTVFRLSPLESCLAIYQTTKVVMMTSVLSVLNEECFQEDRSTKKHTPAFQQQRQTFKK